jgi:hypothetical protein
MVLVQIVYQPRSRIGINWKRQRPVLEAQFHGLQCRAIEASGKPGQARIVVPENA